MVVLQKTNVQNDYRRGGYHAQFVALKVQKSAQHYMEATLDEITILKQISIIHTDLKPENMLLCSTNYPSKDPRKSGAPLILPSDTDIASLDFGTVKSRVKFYGNLTNNQKKIRKIPKKKLKFLLMLIGCITLMLQQPVGKNMWVLREGAVLEGGRRWSLLTLKRKLVDFGNACWTYKRFTDNIQTRQYRCPEVIVGSKYSTSADHWSFACICFELATVDMLFDPHSGDNFDRDEDHLALMMELLGTMPQKVRGFPELEESCSNRSGPNSQWSNISHIPKIEVGGRRIQNLGSVSLSLSESDLVVGRDNDVAEIKRKMLNIRVDVVLCSIPIVDMGGVGKTTVAKKIFNDEVIKQKFEKRVWLCLPEMSDTKSFLEQILESLTEGKLEVQTRDTIVKTLHDKLVGKRYFLVLDDLWHVDPSLWDEFMDSLRELNASRGNCILVTTRSEGVASTIAVDHRKLGK